MNDIMNAKVFGDGYRTCKYTGLPLEVGSGANSVQIQAANNLGNLDFLLAELTTKRKDHEDKLAGEKLKLSHMQAAHDALAADDARARQASAYSLAEQQTVIASCEPIAMGSRLSTRPWP